MYALVGLCARPQINVPEIKKETEKLQQEEAAYLREAK